MRRSLFQRIMLAAVPAFVIVAVSVSTIWGQHGMFRSHDLRTELREANSSLAATQRENDRMLRTVKLMDEDPAVIERMIAQELGWAREGTTLYRLVDPQ